MAVRGRFIFRQEREYFQNLAKSGSRMKKYPGIQISRAFAGHFLHAIAVFPPPAGIVVLIGHSDNADGDVRSEGFLVKDRPVRRA